MTPHIFYIVTAVSFISAIIAFVPIPKENLSVPDNLKENRFHIRRRWLAAGALLTLIPILVKMLFVIFPLIEARIMPIELYASIQKDFWLPFTVLFFAFVSHIVSRRSRRAVVITVTILFLVVVQQTVWHLGRPSIYRYKGTMAQQQVEICGSRKIAA